MRRIVFALALIMIIAGCATGVDIITDSRKSEMSDISASDTTDVDLDEKDMSESLTHETCSSDSGKPDAEADIAYFGLKAEFEKNIELATQSLGNADAPWDVITHLANSRLIFEEMLNHSQSLKCFDESMTIVYGENFGKKIFINVYPTYMEGEISYRVISFGADNLAAIRMYVQMYDEEFLESQCVYVYFEHADISSEIVYCSIINESDKKYLIIIHKEFSFLEMYKYYVVTYEINGKSLRNQDVLRKEFSEGVWTIKGSSLHDISVPFYATTIKISNVFNGTEFFFELDNDSQWLFSNNVLTITLDNDEKNEISLLFEDGYWEVQAIE